MCGRFCLLADVATVTEHFALTQNVVLKPRYNIAPNQLVPVIRIPGTLEFLTWGFKPQWLKADQNPFINARLETIHEKPAFRQAFNHQRCLIIANGYYEWKQVGKYKQPYYITLPQQKLFAFAGVWVDDTCAIITKATQQQEILSIHQRAPAILDPKNYALWLDPKTDAAILQQTLHFADHILTASPVSSKVNNPQNDFVECTKPLQ